MNIVITGGMGCGKSTMVEYIWKMLPSYELFDMDNYVKQLYSNPNIQQQLMDHFTTCDQSRISDIVFSNPVKLRELYDIINNSIFNRMTTIMNSGINMLYDIPLFFEMVDKCNLQFPVDLVVCVTCDNKLQYDRIKSRNNLAEDKLQTMLSNQMPLKDKQNRSNIVIHNDTSLDDALNQVQQLVNVVMWMTKHRK